MIDKDKREFGGWWLWIVFLMLLSVAAFFGLRMAGVFGERIVFENSYQKAASDDDKMRNLRAELASINAQLRRSDLTQQERSSLEAQKAGIEFQLARGE